MSNALITVYAAGKAIGVPAALLVAICTHESGLKNVTNFNDGGSPSHGICQVKFDTAVFLKDTYGIKKDITEEKLKDPQVNAYMAALYLKYQLQRYSNNLCQSVPAYNMGSYIESKVYPGSAVNYSYIKHVQKQLPIEYRYLLDCPRYKKETK